MCSILLWASLLQGSLLLSATVSMQIHGPPLVLGKSMCMCCVCVCVCIQCLGLGRITDRDGRCSNLLTSAQLKSGTYRIRFDTSTYFASLNNSEPFYPYAEVRWCMWVYYCDDAMPCRLLSTWMIWLSTITFHCSWVLTHTPHTEEVDVCHCILLKVGLCACAENAICKVATPTMPWYQGA